MGVAEFTNCAVTEKKCVPQRQDDGSYPVPPDDVLVQKFSTEMLQGDWYISAGFNKAFDVFDCQLHKFEAPSPRKLVGNMQWRIKDPVAATNFVTRYTVQTFDMDEKREGILYNHDNEFLHYQDDWYILAAKDQKYVVVYYRGNNDAWDGYGGAVVYTKAAAFPKEYVPEVSEALLKSCQLPLAKCVTNPTCAANLLCIQTCTNRADESVCQIECGDKFSNDVVAEFTNCAVTEIEKDVAYELNAVEKALGIKK